MADTVRKTHTTHQTQSQQRFPSNVNCELAAYETQLFSRRSMYGRLYSLILSDFAVNKEVIVTQKMILDWSYFMGCHPRTVLRQFGKLSQMRSRYVSIDKNEDGQYVIKYGKKVPHLKYAKQDYVTTKKAYKVSTIGMNILGIVQQREGAGLRQLPQRHMAKRIGCELKTVHNQLKALVKKGLLEKHYIKADYIHPLAKRWRNVYRLTIKAWSHIKDLKDKITTLRYKLRLYARTLKEKSLRYTEKTAKKDPIYQFLTKFKSKFPESKDTSLTKTFNSLKRTLKKWPSMEEVEKAWELFCQNRFLCLAVWVGFKEAYKTRLIQKGAEVSGKSSFFKGYSDRRPNFYWFMTRIDKILAGGYADRPLSEKESGRVWLKKQEHRMADGDYRAEAIPESFGQEYIAGLTCCSRERDIRGQLLGEYGILAYEHWFDKASMDVKADGTWVLQVKDAWTAKTIGAKFPRVDVEVVAVHRIKKQGKGLRQAYSRHLADLEAEANGSLAKAEDTLAQGPDESQDKGDVVQDVAVPVTGSALPTTGQHLAPNVGTDASEGLAGIKVFRIDLEALKEEIRHISSCQTEKAIREALLGKYGGFVYERWIRGCGYDPERQALTHESSFYRQHISDKYGVSVLVPVAKQEKGLVHQDTKSSDKTLDNLWSLLKSAIKGSASDHMIPKGQHDDR